MPYVNIRVIEENLTPAVKRRMIEGVTELLHEILAKDPERIYVIIDEVPLDNWGAGGVNVTTRREQGFDGICTCGAHEDRRPAREARSKTVDGGTPADRSG
jgi:4-oxalocrotonate tautomerase